MSQDFPLVLPSVYTMFVLPLCMTVG